MSDLTTNQELAQALIGFHLSDRWLDRAVSRPLYALYRTLEALNIEAEVRIVNFSAFMKSHKKDYCFSDGVLKVDGLLMDLNGCHGAHEIETRLRNAVKGNPDLMWRGEFGFKSPDGNFFEEYRQRADRDPTVQEFQEILNTGVAYAQAYQLQQVADIVASPTRSRVRL